MEWLIGHLVGDYLFQNDWMAYNKKKKTWRGELACNLHCLIWTLSVLVFTGWWDWTHALLLYGSHYLLDRTRLVNWYVEKINIGQPQTWLYIVADNVLHLLVLLWLDKYV